MLLAGRWFTVGVADRARGPSLPSNALPADFARIPPHSLAGAVLPSVAGTPQAQEAVIANSIPQTATVPLKNGPTFTPNFDGPPQYAPIPGTPLIYVVNSSEPVIQVDADAYYAVVGRRVVHGAADHRAVDRRDVGAGRRSTRFRRRRRSTT